MNILTASALALLLIIFQFAQVSADIPVHCVPSQIQSKWNVQLVPFPSSEPVLPTMLRKCTTAFMKKHVEESTFLTVDITQPNRVLVDKVVKGDLVGKSEEYPTINIRSSDFFDFTMMSDQGFDMINSKYSFFSFFSYKSLKDGWIKSRCDRTQVGWFSDSAKKVFGCFVAYKENPTVDDVVKHRPISETINREDNLSSSSREDDDEAFLNSFQRRVASINKVQKSWIAGHYNETGLRPQDLKKRLGSPVRYSSLNELLAQTKTKKSPLSASANDADDDFLYSIDGSETEQSRKRSTIQSLPKSFDWRDVNGESFVSPVRDQGSCGSCYAMATLDALEARIRIQTKNEHKLDLSVQDVMACSVFSQQCNGGYPLGVARYVSDFGVVTEECMPYESVHMPVNGTCSSKCSNPKVIARASSYGYVGGFLGAGNEEDMMLEIHKSGPIVASFFVHDDFKFYKQGIYSHVEGKAGKKGVVNPIEVTSHSVCIIGWDEDEQTGEKSWIVKNSWGKRFGEEAPEHLAFYRDNCSDGERCGGFFRIRRGVDESAIESATVFLEPKLEFPGNESS